MNIGTLNTQALNSGKSPNATKELATKGDGNVSAFEDILGKSQTEPALKPRADAAKRADQPKKADEPKSSGTMKRAEGPKSSEPRRVDTAKRAEVPKRQEEPTAKADSKNAPVREAGGASKASASVERGSRANTNMTAKLVNARDAQDISQEVNASVADHSEAWGDFLQKMNDELGVSAKNLLEAFSSLSSEELAKPPTENLDKVVMALGLNDQQALLARQFFQQLIQQTETQTTGQDLAGGKASVDAGLGAEFALRADGATGKKVLQSTVDQLNANHLLKNVKGQESAFTAQMKALSEDANLAAEVSIESKAEGLEGQALAPEALKAGREKLMSLDPKEAAIESKAGPTDDLVSKMQSSDSDDKSLEDMVRKFLSNQATPKAAQTKSAGVNLSAVGQMFSGAQAAAESKISTEAALAQMKLGLEGLAEVSSEEEAELAGSDLSALSTPMFNTQGLTQGKMGAILGGAATEVKAGQVLTVPELVQQAQVMVRDGGGEMKVTLHPEGLGQLAMKVSVEHGKVNVQMITESDEARRLIEHQLGDLKSQLTSNHLQVHDIKVDTASNLGRQMDQQYQDAQRQATQMAWEQFRNDSQGWRRSFFDIPTARAYKSQGEAPRDVQIPSGVTAASRGLSSRRLDLVA